MVDKDAALKRLEDFNRRVEEQKQGIPQLPPTVPGTGKTLNENQLRILAAEEGSLSNAEIVEKKAIQTQQEVERAARQRESDERSRQKSEDTTIQKTQQAAQAAANAALDSTEGPTRWLEQVPTVFGLGVILAIIGVFILAVVPVDSSGNTRLKLIWYTLTGKTHLSYQGTSTGGSTGSGDFASFGQSPSQANANLSQQVPIDMSNIPDLSGLDLTNL